ncbi:bifunctional diguanylate cyclase/phosphodiesterase [Bradyrhizobium centrosematis]|uniref:bifunctional diguanylate cyclase/phosphodiesterase n=1 Tax=Bradyrhizobium centrosematis TaxID=1300039 RepID=UPI002167585E|nr:GAF domain-containing protein [Bradyrhizobium centrosematis]MCS3762021.1 diguanylate cyclase (GGDEF)-like protein [Bradyrhizobium centrosematis]MCS3774689.1 diguanylate cyclase (GGDEF)-like protein [Bradyrhizobium centrosematis]
MPTTLARTFAALSAINEAILYAKSPDELYQKVCDAGFSSGDFLAVAVFLAEPDGRLLQFAAGCGDDIPRLRSIVITTEAGTPEGSGVGGEAFRDQKLCVSNDYLNDPRSLAWREGAASAGIGAAAALPLLCNGKSVGVLYVTRREAGSLNEQMVSLFERMSANISYALDNFARATAQKTTERAARRLNRMFGALSATNEAILRAKTEQELYQLVCDASVHGGKSLATIVLLREPDSHWMKPVAATGQNLELVTQARYSVDPDNPFGRGISGEVFRTQKAIVEDDLASRTRGSPWEQANVNTGVAACVVAPLVKRGESVGVLLFFISRSWAKDEEIVALLLRMAENVSFAIENFGRESEKARISAEEERLARMYAALSATNEAIIRATSRAELFDLVCEASVQGGKFGSATIALAEPASELLRVVASAGPNSDEVRSLKFATTDKVPEGRGLTGTCFRTGKPCLTNDLLADDRLKPWYDSARRTGVKSSAALPLLNGDRTEGVFLFNSLEIGTFTPELVELLERLARNVSFAIANLDRAEEKAKADKQRNRLSGMFAALSATNEAIMRAETREELFDVACQAAVLGDMFASATIGIIDEASELVRVVAVKGRLQERMVGRTCAISADHPEGQGIIGISLRTCRPSVINDYMHDPRSAHWHSKAVEDGTRAAASFPLLRDGRKPIGILLFLAPEEDTFTPDLVELLARLAENVSFALDNFERAEEKARTEAQKERLRRMFAALSATNEAIMRAKSRAELFDLVCLAASNGAKFTSTTIALARADSDQLEIVASAGPSADTTRNVRLSIDPERPEGRGMSGTAFRTRQPCISNDYLNDQRVSAFHAVVRGDGARSGAAFPLIVHDQAVGVMIYMSTEPATFTTEFVELLQRLADNVAFAVENFDRADAKNQADERIEYLASHDSLTDLPNRETFNALLRQAIATAERHDHRFAVLFIDLDRFKVINDSLGHEAGDLLLLEVANRLRGALRASDVVARLGGDEFVVILDQCGEIDDVQHIATEILAALAQPMELAGHECHTTASIGIAMYPANGSDAQTLTKNADMAMYLAKEDGKNGYRFFSKEVKTQSIERLSLESALRRALERGQFSLNYQPKVEMETGQITGVEALLRWNHPELGNVSPAQFIPLAEETGLIVPIGRWVLNEACAQAMAWQRRGLLPLSMAVNLSPRQFADEHLLQDVDEALAASGMSPVLLQLEVTESMMMRNVGRALKVLDAIQSRGIRLAIDDFGTGYSSMSLMKHFPIDTIKIDRSFVRDLPQDSEDQAIAQAIISMGKALGMTVVAEGVENAEQEAFLRTHGCDEMQGFLISKPVPAREMAELLRPMVLPIAPPLQPEPDAVATEAAASRLRRAVV